MSKRAVILGGNPYLSDVYRKDAKTLFDETGGNSGNLAFIYAVASHLRGARFMHWGAPAAQVRAAGDIIVLPLANQLGSHTDLGQAAAKLEEIDLPVIGLGLGAQAASYQANVQLTDGTRKWLNVMSQRRPSEAPNIGVRGQYTLAQISKIGGNSSATITGCPSNFINTADDIAASISRGFERSPRHIAVTAGIPYIPALANIERDLAELVTHTGGAYIVQHGLQMLQLARNEFDKMPGDVLEQCRQYISPNRSLDEFKSWCRQYAYAFYDARAWMDFLRRYDFVIGTRFHGAMLAIQAGVAAACIAHDSRTVEMCETMGVPVRHHNEIKGALTQRNILEYFSFDASKYRESRQRLLFEYIRVLRGADLELPPSLSN
jgi:hypothetical protein